LDNGVVDKHCQKLKYFYDILWNSLLCTIYPFTFVIAITWCHCWINCWHASVC